MRNPQPTDDELGAIYTEQYFLVPGMEADRLKRGTAAGYLDEIEARLGTHRSPDRPRPRLLEVGSGLGNLLLEAQGPRLRRDRRRVFGELGAGRERAARRRMRTPGIDRHRRSSRRVVRRCGTGRRHRAHARPALRPRARLAPPAPGWRRVHRAAQPRQLVGPADAGEVDGVQAGAPVLLRQLHDPDCAPQDRFRRGRSLDGVEDAQPRIHHPAFPALSRSGADANDAADRSPAPPAPCGAVT